MDWVLHTGHDDDFYMQGFEPADLSYPFGAHLAVVQVDSETGEVSLQRYVAVDDYGHVLVPTLVEGQTHSQFMTSYTLSTPG